MADGWQQRTCPGCGLFKQWWKDGQMLTDTFGLRDEGMR